MAYILRKQPDLFQPAYNSNIFIVTSDDTTQPNFKYLADIYIGTDIIRLKTFPNPTYGAGLFDVGRIVETYVKSDFDLVSRGFTTNPNSYKAYYIKFGQEFGPSSGVVQYPNLLQTETKYVWNAILPFVDMQNYAQIYYDADNANTLSYDSALNRKVSIYDNSFLYYFCESVDSFIKADITIYDSAGTIIRQGIQANPFNSSGTADHHFIKFNTGLSSMNSLVGGTGWTDIIGSGSLITDASSYSVYFTGDTISKGYYYEITDADCKFPTCRIHWLNKYGGFESFNFTKRSDTETKIVRNKYRPMVGGLTSATTYGYNMSDRGTKSFTTKMDDVLKLQSDWLTDLESDLLQSLVESPEIYYESQKGLLSMTCADSSYKTRTTLNDKVFQLHLTLEYCYSRYSQRQ